MIQIAMVEDDTELAGLLTDFLANYSMEVSNYATPKAFLEGVKNHAFDLAIIDLTLPQMDGLEVCKSVRAISELPFIISSARSDISDKLIGLERGADDYLPKPYDPRELVARIQTILRRHKHPLFIAESSRLELDEKKMSVTLDGRALELTVAEFEILKLLITTKGSVLSRDYIAENVSVMRWESGERSIDVVISRIRKKLGDNPKTPEFIKSVKGAGYKFVG
jgi:two-component system, OmpR family, response regulator